MSRKGRGHSAGAACAFHPCQNSKKTSSLIARWKISFSAPLDRFYPVLASEDEKERIPTESNLGTGFIVFS